MRYEEQNRFCDSGEHKVNFFSSVSQHAH